MTDVRLALGGVAHRPWRAHRSRARAARRRGDDWHSFRRAAEAELAARASGHAQRFQDSSWPKRAIVSVLSELTQRGERAMSDHADGDGDGGAILRRIQTPDPLRDAQRLRRPASQPRRRTAQGQRRRALHSRIRRRGPGLRGAGLQHDRQRAGGRRSTCRSRRGRAGRVGGDDAPQRCRA